jgi:hypothetical protein
MASRRRSAEGELEPDDAAPLEPDADADFHDEVLPDNTRPPVGAPADGEG